MALKDYIKKVSRKARYLIGASLFYLLALLVMSFFFEASNALFFAQMLLVVVLCFPFLYPELGDKLGLNRKTK